MKLILPEALGAQIRQAAQRAFPRECCGLIEGLAGGDAFKALALHPAPDGNKDRFNIDPAIHFAALKIARTNGHAIIGCYHSHPNGVPAPSQADGEGAAEQGFLWLIAALNAAAAQPELSAFVYSADGFTEIGVATGADLVTSSSKARS